MGQLELERLKEHTKKQGPDIPLDNEFCFTSVMEEEKIKICINKGITPRIKKMRLPLASIPVRPQQCCAHRIRQTWLIGTDVLVGS